MSQRAVLGQGWGEAEANATARRCPSSTPEDRGDQQLCPTSTREAGRLSQLAKGTSGSLPLTGNCNVLASPVHPVSPASGSGAHVFRGVLSSQHPGRQHWLRQRLSPCPPGTGTGQRLPCRPMAPVGWAPLPTEGEGAGGVGHKPSSQTGKIHLQQQLCRGSGGCLRECHRLGKAVSGCLPSTALPVPADLLRRRRESKSPPRVAVQGCSLSQGSPDVWSSSCHAHTATGERGHWEEVAVKSLKPCSRRLCPGWLSFKNLLVSCTAQMVSGRVEVKESARAEAEVSGWQPEPCMHAPPFEPV